MRLVPGRLLTLALCATLAMPPGVIANEPVQVRRAYAKSLIETAQYGDAINAYQKIADDHPDDAQSHYELASAQVFIRMYVDALEPMTRARELAPDEPRYHALAAMVHLTLLQYDQAFEASISGARLGDDRAMFTLVGMYEEGRGTLQDTAQALHWLMRAANAGHLVAMDMLSLAYTQGDFGVAVNDVKAAAWRKRLREAEASLD